MLAACAHRGVTPGSGDDSALPQDAPTTSGSLLGAHYSADGGSIIFRVASTRATRIEVWLYDAPTNAAARDHVALQPEAGGSVWRAEVPAGSGTVYYGYRVWGPNWPYDASWQPGSDAGWIADVDSAGNRMNPNKLVFDPYARELSNDPTTPAQGDTTPYATGTHRDLDSAAIAPKGIVLHDDTPATHVTRAFRDDVVYEVQVRGFTEADPAAGTCAGTYAGAATRAQYIADLGVTAIELLPIAETSNDRNDVDPTSDSGDNYWGYSTLAYFAPDRRYACDRSAGGPTREIRDMVRAFHDKGVKVYLDVVYNHTAEGSGGSLFSLRGLDNAGYYQLDAAGTGFTNSNGVGADLAGNKPLAHGLVLDSLHYWADSIGIDGFRFDLAPVLGNTCVGCFKFDGTLPADIAALVRPDDGGDGIDVIAEPWGTVANSYEVGHFPRGWAEWNDKFRDAIKRDQNQVGTLSPGAIMTRIEGSPDVYKATGRLPTASINYLVSHDGLTLHDTYACNASNNTQAWPYGPSSGGTTNNISWDHNGDPVSQRQAARTGLALMALSHGVPMITGGDEMGRTIKCNNNSYNLDSTATWLDWSLAGTPFTTYASRLFQFRGAHPALREPTWFGSELTLLDGHGAVATAAYLADVTKTVVAWRIDGADPIYVAYNRGATAVTLTLPTPPAGKAWYLVGDTSIDGEALAVPGSETVMTSPYAMAARSVVLVLAR